ncbi:MAG TPA: glycoside hydrolase family 3 C-terminal domain-containing protein [Candidatus Acidoferrum sp.]|nr:glycoside hydrolase family 3 C-terminal domain-containing protein [Candidatus Acidoferrum sp.]
MLRARTIFSILLVAFAIRTAAAQAQRPAPAHVEKRIDALLAQMTLEEKIELIGGTNSFYTRSISRLGITSLKMSDGPLGVHDYGPTTAYVAGIDLAASWDADLARRVGASMGRDARARGVNIVLAPGLNIYRAPMNGRNFEYFGEDPYLASRMAVGVVEGMQSEDVIATVKHFVANNMEYGRNDHSSDVDERTLREIYLPAFEAAVREAHVGAVMDAYNLVNGEHMTQNAHLNKEILKGEWGFDGILMSDWGATHDGVAAANGGLDLEMPSAVYMTPETLLPAIKEGRVSVATIDDKVRRILRMGIRFGFFGHDQTDPDIPLYNQQGRELVREEARDGMVLLKNKGGLLPLDKTKLKTIAVIGPDAYPAVIGGGGSSLTQPFNQVSYLEGISNYLGPRVKVLSAVDSVPAADVADKTEFRTSSDGPIGLEGEYFDNRDLEGAPAVKRVDPRIDFEWGDGSYAPGHAVDNFSARWTGYYIAKMTGDYTFYVSADDGVRLYLENERIINDWTAHSETVDVATRHLEAGKPYAVKLEYFEGGGEATARFGVINTAEVLGRETKPLAARVDAVILCVGFDPSTESEGFDRTFHLPNGQDELIRQIASVNKNVIVVLTAGGNVDMTGWLDRVPALLDAWYPGQEGGTALAQILFGDYSPSGKLPASFERRWEDDPAFHSYYPQSDKRVAYTEGIFLGYRYYEKSTTKPLFPFGFGLSYTRFQYANLNVSRRQSDDPDSVAVSFDVKNIGTRAGAEVAELYVGDSHSSVPRPVKELKGFAKVFLQPGEMKRVNLMLNRRSFSYYDVKNKQWTAEPGEFSILVGSSSEKIELTGSFTLTKAGPSRALK